MNAWLDLERFFGWLLHTTGQAAVLALLILLAQFLLRTRLSPSWRHGLWFLLVVRLLLPVAPRSAVSVFNLAHWSRLRAHKGTEAAQPIVYSSQAILVARERAVVEPAPPITPLPTPGPRPRPSEVSPTLTAPPVSPSQTTLTRPFDWWTLATTGWLVGVLILALRFLWLNHRFRRRLACYVPITDRTVRTLCQECADALGVRTCPVIIETVEVDTPAVYGLWGKRLLLPDGLSEQLTPDELRHVLRHELAHLKRRDPEWNWLIALLQIVHWFNPVLWWAFARMRADRELATDELALASVHPQERTRYGETVLKVLERLTERQGLPSLVGIGEAREQIKERIRAIARGSTGPRWRWAACAVAVGLAGVTLTNAREGQSSGINLLNRYPTTLTTGDTSPDRARPWQFTPNDIYQVSRFSFKIDKQLHVETEVADLGIGHCADGAIWAVLLPRNQGTLTSPVAKRPEPIQSVWLRFHPSLINKLFPARSVVGPGRADLLESMRAIERAKFRSSWHAGNNAMIPPKKDLTVDVDTRGGPRRFFVVDTHAQTARYIAAFAGRSAQAAAPPAYVPPVDPKRARVISVSPPNGATDVALRQEIRIHFDRPMNPHYLELEWLTGGFQLTGSIQVSADRKEFTIPVQLTPGSEQQLAVNRDWQREMWARAGRPAAGRPSGSDRQGFLDSNLLPANEFRWSFSTRPDPIKPGASAPHVLHVSPASDATTPVLTMVKITFDQPMRSPHQTFPYVETRPFARGPNLIPSFDYDAATHCFTVPALLRPEDDTRLTLYGFYGADGIPCEPVVLHYRSSAASLGQAYRARAKAAATDPELRKLLAEMKAARAELHSGIETVQTIRLTLNQAAFNKLESKTATFRWQGTHQVYADITGPMMMSKAFILGCDGENCWLYSEDNQGKQRLDETPVAATDCQIAILDPFRLSSETVTEALRQQEMVYAGQASLEGRRCYRVERWEVSQNPMAFATQTQWWIDAQTFLPYRIVQYYPMGCQIVRFDYRELNQTLPQSEFQPPVAPGGAAQPLFFKKPPTPNEHRFLRISDGSNGRMAGRLGWHGPNGTTSSGLN